MALILSLKEGDRFHVGDDTITIVRVIADDHFMIETSKGDKFDITQDKMLEVFPDVFVSVAAKVPTGMARVAVEAPREMLILRDKNKGRAKGKFNG